jgi:hypothetical protein
VPAPRPDGRVGHSLVRPSPGRSGLKPTMAVLACSLAVPCCRSIRRTTGFRLTLSTPRRDRESRGRPRGDEPTGHGAGPPCRATRSMSLAFRSRRPPSDSGSPLLGGEIPCTRPQGGDACHACVGLL